MSRGRRSAAIVGLFIVKFPATVPLRMWVVAEVVVLLHRIVLIPNPELGGSCRWFTIGYYVTTITAANGKCAALATFWLHEYTGTHLSCKRKAGEQ